MDRMYGRGIGVGQFLQRQNMSKADVLDYFRKHAQVENCSESCPFAEECDNLLAMSDEELSLCDILGIS